MPVMPILRLGARRPPNSKQPLTHVMPRSIPLPEILAPEAAPPTASPQEPGRTPVSGRAVALGLGLSVGLAALNAWIETFANVHFLGGVHLPFGAVFILMALVLGVNVPLRALNSRLARPLSRGELLTVYAMTLLAALVSTPGTENFFLSAGPTLFYFSTRENHWADTFYRHIPSWWAPGWDGHTFQREVVDGFFTGQVSPSQIPWHAWMVMLLAWSGFCLLLYGLLFFTALLFRKQWIESEALAFPLVQLPLQMVETGAGQSPPAREFWANRLMWLGFGVAAAFHLLRGLNNYFPQFPVLTGFQGNQLVLNFTEAPLSAIGSLNIEWYFGAVGVAYLLTREMSFSFWTSFLLVQVQLVAAAQMGFVPDALPKEPYGQRPHFLAFQSLGAWLGMGALLLWGAREQLKNTFLAALNPRRASAATTLNEPFSARFVVVGWAACFVGLCAWCSFAGLSPWLTVGLFGSFVLLNIVLARLVVEGGVLFPQLSFSPLYMVTQSGLSASFLGAANLTKLSFLSPMLFGDLRTTTLPAYLHTFKLAHDAQFSPRDTRRLCFAVLAATGAAFAVTILTALVTVYEHGGLSGYTWFTYQGPQMSFNATSALMTRGDSLDFSTWPWIALGAFVVVALAILRSRFLWFSLHPLGYVFSTAQPMRRLWFSFFLGWAVKSLLLKYGGSDSVQKVRPFMIGLIFGNVCAMVAWMIVGFFLGSQIQFWPA